MGKNLVIDGSFMPKIRKSDLTFVSHLPLLLWQTKVCHNMLFSTKQLGLVSYHL